jgi:hypothetical protein
MNAINRNLYFGSIPDAYRQQNACASKTGQKQQSFADMVASIQQARAAAQPMAAAATSRANQAKGQDQTLGATAPNVVEEQNKLLQEIMDSLSESARGGYPTEGQLDMLREKYKDADFSAYRTYDNIAEYGGGGLSYSPGMGYSEAYGSLLKDLRDMGILSAQDINLLNSLSIHVNREDMPSRRNGDNLSDFDKFWYEWDIPNSTVLSGRGTSISIVDYLLGIADIDRRAAEDIDESGEKIFHVYRADGYSANAEFFASRAEARERVAHIIDAIANGVEGNEIHLR